jgi:hypothetical protein
MKERELIWLKQSWNSNKQQIMSRVYIIWLNGLPAVWPWAQILEGSVVFQQQLEVTLIQWILHMLLKL